VSLAPGVRLGPYEITALIGEGGMGKVWRAHHTALNRDDALKVLPDAFASDPERLARFRREAQVLASLNHPNIAHVYGLEQADGVQALVMELVEGETLADRIARGPIPVDEALQVAKQIAEALEAAHEQGIIHRDLKPSNIKLRPDGTVKVLDFGLAKLTESLSSPRNPSALSISPTITSPAMTGIGVLLGTAAYMSPEQARGKAVDKRADIWAFGVVLYEMLTGKRAFDGEDVTDTLAAVVRSEPKWDALPHTVSPSVRIFFRRCLSKDPKERVGDIRDVRLALAGAFDVPATATEPSRLTALRRTWPWVAAAVVLSAGVTGVVMRRVMAAPAQQPVRRLEHMLPRSLELAAGSGSLVVLSPDGHTLIYRARENGVWRAYRRPLDELQAQPIAGTENLDQSPFLSADGRWVGFTIGSELMKVSLAGGRPLRVGELPAPQQRGSSWGSDNSIVVGAVQRGLLRIPATGGKAQVLVAPEEGRQYWYPQVLPGGRAVLFTASQPAPDTGDVFALDLATGMTRLVIRDGVAGRYMTTGHLVFLRGGDVWAVPFDLQRLAISGDPVVVEQGIRVELGGAVQFALADDGTLAYIPASGNESAARKLVWVDRAGKEEPLPAPQRAYGHPRISPDGGRVAVDTFDQERDIWIWNVVGQTLTRLTFGREVDQSPVWWPDGRSLIFASGLAAGSDIFRQAADGTGSRERLTEGVTGKLPTSVTPDGAEILIREVIQDTGVDLARLRVSPTSPQKLNTPTPLVRTTFAERNAEVSPGGQWVAYESNDSGRPEIYVRPFPDVNGGRWQVSTSGGRMPLWSRDGGELFYVSPDDAMMVSRVEAGRTWVAATPVQLFRGDYLFATGANTRTFDIAPDGKRFLMVKDIETANAPQASIVVVEHFDEELKRLVPIK